MERLRIFLRNFKIGVTNLIYYGKTIWNDRDWDFSYMDDLLLLKLKKMKKRYEGEDHVKSEGEGKNIVQPLRICINILERIEDDWYINTWHSINYKEDSDIFDDTIYEYDHPTKGLGSFHKIEERDRTILFKIMGKYSAHWWD